MSDAIRTFQTEDENGSAFREFFARQTKVKAERLLAVDTAAPALDRLVSACAHKTGQGYKLRSLLFSMWNGKPADLTQTLGLDWELKKDFCAVLLAFGDDTFFYDRVSAAFAERGLLGWFVEEGQP